MSDHHATPAAHAARPSGRPHTKIIATLAILVALSALIWPLPSMETATARATYCGSPERPTGVKIGTVTGWYVWLARFDTAADLWAGTNPRYFWAGDTVARSANSIGVPWSRFSHDWGLDDQYTELIYQDASGQVVYVALVHYNQWETGEGLLEVSSSTGVYWVTFAYCCSYNGPLNGIGMPLACTRPDGVYYTTLRAWWLSEFYCQTGWYFPGVGVVYPCGGWWSPFAYSVSYQVGGDSSCPCQGPSPSPSPSLSPSPSPSASPSASPSPSPSPSPLPAPTVIAPMGCISIPTPPRPRIDWGDVDGAEGYELWLLQGDIVKVHRNDLPYSEYQVSADDGLDDNVEYRWRVRAYNSTNGDYTDSIYFTPNCEPEEPPIPQAPGGCVETETPTFSWSAVTSPPGSQVDVSYSGSVTRVGPPDEQIWSWTTTSTSVIAPPGTFAPPSNPSAPYWPKYRWTVRARFDSRPGPPSDPVEFKIRCNPDPDQTEVPEKEEVEKRPLDCMRVGKPVSVHTGNMYLDQTDVVVPGVTGVMFARSYNSDNLQEGQYGMFGPGWSHSYERALRLTYQDVLELRKADGTVIYFKDLEHDGRFEHGVPVTERSEVVKQLDGSYVREFRAGGSERYDADGHLTAIVDRVGNTTTLVRGAGGRLESIADEGGRAVSLTYEDGHLRRVAAPGDLEWASYTYYPEGALKTVTYADGSGYEFVYEGPGRLLTVKDAVGRILESHTYDAQGRAQTSAISEGREGYTLVYGGNQTTVTDALGNETLYEYEERNQIKRVVRVTGPCDTCSGGGSESQEWDYDTSGRVIRHRDAAGRETYYEYDPDTGDLMLTKDALLQPTLYTYWPDGRLKTRAGPDGSFVRITYVDAGPSETRERIGPNDTRTTRIVYGPEGHGKPTEVVDAREKSTRFTYYDAGDLKTVEDPLGRVMTYGYDDMGRRRWVKDHLDRETWTEYDGRGRVKKVIAPDDTFTETTYDLAGRVSSVKDPLRRVTRSGYDLYGRLQFLEDALKGATRYDYDLMSRLTGLTDASGRTTAYAYDAYGRRVTTTYPGSGIEQNTYDDAGRMETYTDRNGVRSTFAYDPVGRLLERKYSDATPSVTHRYDSGGRMVQAANSTDTLTWTYDLLGRVLTESSERNGTEIRYSYDAAGNRRTISVGDDEFARYNYNDANQPESITRGARTIGFGHEDPLRPGVLRQERMSLTSPNGVTTSYQYDDLSRLQRIKAQLGGATISDVVYEHDDAGNRTKRTTPQRIEGYAYDSLDRLEQATRTGHEEVFTYDSVGNRTSRQVDGTLLLRSGYNERNQLVDQAGGGPVLWRGELNEPGGVSFTSATVNDLPARMLSGNVFEAVLEMNPGLNVVTVEARDVDENVTTRTYELDAGAQVINYDYDDNGNLIRKEQAGAVWIYEWNAANQLTRVTRDGLEVARFAYDPAGRRAEKVVGGVTYSYLYDGQDILRETRSSGTTTATYWYVHGPGIDEPLVRIENLGGEDEGWLYQHADGLGSIVRITDQAGNIVKSFDYDAWGNIQCPEADSTCADEGGYRFTGREWDPEIGLYYYRARYYDPKIGRFISEDPIGLEGGINFYSYVDNQPVNGRDPSGLFNDVWLPNGRPIPSPRRPPAVGPPIGAWGSGVGGLITLPRVPGSTWMIDAACFIVGDRRGNTGVLCCSGAGIAIGGGGGVSPQGGSALCPNCKTICDMEGFYVQTTLAGAGGVGGASSGGIAISPNSDTVTGIGMIGPAGGAVASFAPQVLGYCSLVTQVNWPGQCKCQ